METTTIEPPKAKPVQEPATATKPCATCGTIIEYECIWIAGRDFGASLHLLCEPCQQKADDEQLAHELAKVRAEREARVQATIPPDLLLTDTEHPEFNRALWRGVEKWRPTESAFWLGLVGPAGKCKTRCLALAAAAAIRRGRRVVWTTANRLHQASHDRRGYGRDTAALAKEHIADCMHAGVLVLDDLGKNEWDTRFECCFFEILDYRKNNRLPLLFSSNAHPEQFSLVLSDLNREPIIGRLMDRTDIIRIRA